MYSTIFLLSLAVFGASAGCINTCGCGPALQGPTCFGATPVIENPTRILPTILPSTSVSQSCHCMKTIVRPQIRNEIITSPSVDRIVRYVPSPVVEAVSVNSCPASRTVEVPTCGVNAGVAAIGGLNGIVGGYNGIVGGYNGVVGGCNGVVGSYPGFVAGAYPGVVGGCGNVVAGGCGNLVAGGCGGVSGVFPSSVVGTGYGCNNVGVGCGNIVGAGCGNVVGAGCLETVGCGATVC